MDLGFGFGLGFRGRAVERPTHRGGTDVRLIMLFAHEEAAPSSDWDAVGDSAAAVHDINHFAA